MPRIRSIKPQFFSDEKVGKLTRDARLLFIGIWCWSDDEGIIIWLPEYLRSIIFPYDGFTVQEVQALMKQLTNKKMVRAYRTKRNHGETYAQVVNFNVHQRINRPQPSSLPKPSWHNQCQSDANGCKSGANDGQVDASSCKVDAKSMQVSAKVMSSVPKDQQSDNKDDVNNKDIDMKQPTTTPFTDESLNNHGALTDDSLSCVCGSKEGGGEEGGRRKDKEEGVEREDVSLSFSITQNQLDKMVRMAGDILKIEAPDIFEEQMLWNCNHYSLPLVEEALNVAREKQITRWSYVVQILKNWESDGKLSAIFKSDASRAEKKKQVQQYVDFVKSPDYKGYHGINNDL